jgi:hypothetical protein
LFTLNNVIITPDSRTGLDDYYERLPKGCSALINGQPWNNEVNNIDPYKLDGDWCVVGFLGGSLDTPYILRWWPHPGNRFDAATSGQSNPNDRVRRPYLVQDSRFFHRINGVEFVISKQGHVYLSTYRANSNLAFGTPLQPQDGRFPRTLNEEEGGSFKAWIKPSQSFELDWNVPTNGLGVLDETDPDLPQTNPARAGVAQAKENTYLIADQTRFELDVPELFKVQSKRRILLTSEEDTTLTTKTSLNIAVETSFNANVKGSYTTLVGDSLLFEVTGNTEVTSTGETQIASVGNVSVTSQNNLTLATTGERATISGASILGLSARDTAVLAANAITIGGNSVVIENSAGPGSGSLDVTAAGVALNSGTLGGVVCGIPLNAAFANFLAAITAAQSVAPTSTVAYAAAVTAAVTALVAQLPTAVSTKTLAG